MRRPLTALLAAALLAAGADALRAQASLTAELTLHDRITGAPANADGGQPVRLRVRLTDPATGRPPRGLTLLGWVRNLDRNNESCARAAQNFRATRNTPLGAIDLNGILLAVANRDGALTVVDPKLNLFTSNLIAAHKFDRPADVVAVDARSMRALLTFPDRPGILTAELTGPGRGVLNGDIVGVTSLGVTSNGMIWAALASGKVVQMDGSGQEIARSDLGDGPAFLRARDDDDDDTIEAFTGQGVARLFDGATGTVLMDASFSAPVADVAFAGTSLAIALLRGEPRAEIRYADAPDLAQSLPLGQPFARVSTGPDARVALAHSPGSNIVAIIDLALGRVVQSIALNAGTVSEVAFTDNVAFILSHDGGFMGAVDLATVALGRDASVRYVNLGSTTPRPPGDGRLLLPLFPSPQIVAVDPQNQTGWLVGEIAAGVEMPPMDSIRLRGGIPRSVHLVRRNLEEVAPGTFEVTSAFDAGEKELILTTYAGELSTCIPFRVRGEAEQRSLVPVTLELIGAGTGLQAGRRQELSLRVLTPGGETVPLDRLDLLVPSMLSGWREVTTATADADGNLHLEITLPHAGVYAIQPMALPEGYALRSALTVQAR